ncbi:leucine-rich repeat and WD repeat-containing protein 1-like isoform X2 [Palaemon carinicauda]|uniref:leucine-rich repeat and WD repeat-containing protein 1-like isoform X2 n=1 Tax=Palaemon carinicauda TaxID=392227 RepID=UPI0035B57F97
MNKETRPRTRQRTKRRRQRTATDVNQQASPEIDLVTESVWQCLFEPHLYNPSRSTGIVVTCGGSSICFTRVQDGEVLLKFDQPNAEKPLDLEFTAMAWTTMSLDPAGNQKTNILAVGGTGSMVVLLDAKAETFVGSFFTLHRGATCIVTALVFHPKHPSWVICGHDDGHIQIWDIGTYDSSYERLRTIAPALGTSHVYNMVYSQGHDLLMVGYDEGLFAWDCPIGSGIRNGEIVTTMFHLPDIDDVGSRVDSLCLLQDDLVAVKCAGNEYIYMFAISEVLQTMHSKTRGVNNAYKLTIPASKILKLRWSETNIRCMSMGADQISSVLVCGDDGGTIVVYSLAPYVNGKVSSPLTGGKPIDPVQPSLILPWPQPEDELLEQTKNLQLTAHGTCMNGSAVSPGGKYIVAVTSNNLVFIWERSEAKLIRKGQRGISQ